MQIIGRYNIKQATISGKISTCTTNYKGVPSGDYKNVNTPRPSVNLKLQHRALARMTYKNNDQGGARM